MFGYVSNRTGEIFLFRTHDEAVAHATDAGFTRFTIRSVVDRRNTRPGRPAGAPADGSMAAFLAGGQ